MNGLKNHAIPIGALQAASAKPRGDMLERMTSVDLCAPAIAIVAGRADAGARALGLQPREATVVHDLERQLSLEPFARTCVQIGGGLQGTIAIEVCAITQEAKRLADRTRPCRRSGRTGKGRSFQRLAAGRAQRPRSLRLELPTGKCNPFICNGF